MRFKPGISLALAPNMTKALPAIEEAFQVAVQQEATITSGTDGEHHPHSLHYVGLAVDLRTRTLRADQIPVVQAELRAHLNGAPDRDTPYNVVIEPSHLHVEWDPA